MITKRKNLIAGAALVGAAALALTGCAGSSDPETTSDAGSGSGADRPIEIAVFNG